MKTPSIVTLCLQPKKCGDIKEMKPNIEIINAIISCGSSSIIHNTAPSLTSQTWKFSLFLQLISIHSGGECVLRDTHSAVICLEDNRQRGSHRCGYFPQTFPSPLLWSSPPKQHSQEAFQRLTFSFESKSLVKGRVGSQVDKPTTLPPPYHVLI